MKDVWILVHVYRGLIEEPEIFHSERAAHRREAELRKDFHGEYDELEVFRKKINVFPRGLAPARQRHAAAHV